VIKNSSLGWLDRYRLLIAKPAALLAASAGIGAVAVALTFAKRSLVAVQGQLLLTTLDGGERSVPAGSQELINLLEIYWEGLLLLGAAVFLLGVSLAGVVAKQKQEADRL